MANREDLVKVFEDTKEWYETDGELKQAVKDAIRGTKIYMEEDMPSIPVAPEKRGKVTVTQHKTLEAAYLLHQVNPDARVMVHNFASATNPGGGVTRGSRAQEECLCRTTTLYPVLNTDNNWEKFYQFHRSRHDQRYTDACIYTPDILAVKTDTDIPQRLPKDQWMRLGVITCAAPNLRAKPGNAMNPTTGDAVHLTDAELLAMHEKRARHLLSVAAANGADILVLGAFGCGAFQNKPEVVAKAYAKVLPDFLRYFQHVEFAVYCPSTTSNRSPDASTTSAPM